MPFPNYPRTVAEVLDPAKKHNPAALHAVKAFARSKPWRGCIAERQEKFGLLNAALAAAFRVPEPSLVFETDEALDSGSSCYAPATRTIRLRGRLSVVTYLHEVGHFLYGPSEYRACRWSLSLFRQCFPKSWARVSFDGHMVRSPRSSWSGSAGHSFTPNKSR